MMHRTYFKLRDIRVEIYDEKGIRQRMYLMEHQMPRIPCKGEKWVLMSISKRYIVRDVIYEEYDDFYDIVVCLGKEQEINT